MRWALAPCTLGTADVPDCFRQLPIRPQDAWQFVNRVGDEYYVDLVHVFGESISGDSWNVVGEVLCSILRAHGLLVSTYVDNMHVLTPPHPVTGLPQPALAQSGFAKFLSMCSRIGCP